LAVNAAVSSVSPGTPVRSGTPPLLHTSAFYFKAPVLQLDVNSKPNTTFLVITNHDAIIEARVFGTAVAVDTTGQFTINVLSVGQSQVYLSARMRDGEVKTITCTVVVSDATGEVANPDCTEKGNSKITGILSYEFETVSTIAFSLEIAGEDISVFRLSAVVISGDIAVGIVGNMAQITYRSANSNFEIMFTATIDDEIVAITHTLK